MTDFARCFQQLRAERTHATLWSIAGALGVLGAWLCWAMWAKVALYEVSTEARVGQRVRRDEVLLELDAMPQQLQLREQEVQTQGLVPQLAKLHSQIEAERSTRAAEGQSARLGAGEAQNRVREAEMAAEFAERELARVRKLQAQQLIAARDLDKAENEAGRLQSVVAALRLGATRIPQEQAAHDREHEVRIARLEGEAATLEAQRATLAAETVRLNYEIERRRIRAPVDGHVGEAVNVRVGAVVAVGDRLGSIVPEGHLLVVAQYSAQAAFGRIRAGEPATLRLQGFPWAEFGTVSARVERVAQEVRDGKVRVELALSDTSGFRGTLQHGMPGTLEVSVEGVSPFGLILRTAGQWLTRPP